MLSLTACKRDNGDELSDKSIFDGGHQYSQTTLDRFYLQQLSATL